VLPSLKAEIRGSLTQQEPFFLTQRDEEKKGSSLYCVVFSVPEFPAEERRRTQMNGEIYENR
jgi:hypothetical protein